MFSPFRKRKKTIIKPPTDVVSASRLRILHLGFEDFRKPGNGGGSIRTHEINRRIAKTHDVTVLTTKFKGSVDRVEDGVRYVHIGLPLGYFGGILSYFVSVPFALRRYQADLVVEDFAAPFSSCLSPLWTRRKTMAVVQWFNAKEKSKQYHLPFWITEKIGAHLQNRYIAVSNDLRDQILAENPKATVTVIGNGVPQAAFREPLGRKGKDILYVGRLERAQKGLDLLLDAFAQIADKTDANLLLVGNGPDETWVRSRIAELRLTERIILKGRVEGKTKNALYARAKVVAMPSRFETFGMVAIEGLAGGTPVVAFDIPCLREVVPNRLGTLVPPFDTSAYAKALLKAVSQKDSLAKEQARRDFAAQYDWDKLALEQQTVYEQEAAGLFVSSEHAKTLDASQKVMESLFVSIARKHTHKKRSATMALIGNYGNGNTGDEAILAGLYDMASPYVTVSVLARNAKEIHEIHGLTASERGSLKGIRTVLHSDVFAIGGGGIFGQGMSPLVRILPHVGLLLSFFGKDVIFVAIGTDPTMPPSTARALKMLGRHAYAVTVREKTTAKFFGKEAHPVVVEDPAISLQPATPREIAKALGHRQTNRRLLISLKPTPDTKGNEQLIENAAAAADWWIEHTGKGVDFLCLSVHGDFGHGMNVTDKTMARAARKLARHDDRITIIGPNLPPRIAKGLIHSATGVIGARLHALIFAHATNTPVFGLTFETKSRVFLTSIHADYADVDARPDKLYHWLELLARGEQ